MSTTKAITPTDAAAIPLSLVKQHLRLELDDISQDELLAMYLYAAWSKAEKFCNQLWGSRTVETTFSVTEPYELPTGSGPVTAVRGFITSLDQLPTVESYWNEYIKGIVVNRDYPIDYYCPPTYTVTHTLLREPEPDVVVAILKLIGELYENREDTSPAGLHKPLSISVQTLLAPYRKID